MKIRKGMEAKYSEWLEKRKSDPYGKLMLEALDGIGEVLDNRRRADDAVRMVLSLSRSALSAGKRVQIAVAIAFLHENGDAFRFEWNRHYQGEDWALEMESSDEKRLYDPL